MALEALRTLVGGSRKLLGGRGSSWEDLEKFLGSSWGAFGIDRDVQRFIERTVTPGVQEAAILGPEIVQNEPRWSPGSGPRSKRARIARTNDFESMRLDMLFTALLEQQAYQTRARVPVCQDQPSYIYIYIHIYIYISR